MSEKNRYHEKINLIQNTSKPPLRKNVDWAPEQKRNVFKFSFLSGL